MKKVLLAVLLMIGFVGISQIQTNKRWAGIGPGGGLNTYLSDSTDLVTIDCDYQSGHGIFMNPKDSLLYGILRGPDASGEDRNLYIMNPFTGDIDLVYDLSTVYISSADIDATGDHIYVIQGNGGGGADLGKVIRLNLTDFSETLVGTIPSVPGASSFGMEFHAPDSSLYVYEGSWDGDTRLHVMDLATGGITSTDLVGYASQIHGALYTGDAAEEFLVFTSYGCSFLETDGSPEVLTEYYNSCMPETQDIAEFLTLYAESDSVAICPEMGDVTEIEFIYNGINSYAWYRDGILLPGETEESLTVDLPGVYHAEMEIKETTGMIISEEITVYLDADCIASLETNDTFFEVYPNPFTDEIQFRSEDFIESITLINMNGQEVLSQTIQGHSGAISTTHLPHGNYIIRMVTEKGSHYQQVVK